MPPSHRVPSVDVTGVPDPIPDQLHVLDVREPVEWRHGHIQGALHIPLAQVPRRLDEVPSERTLVVCKIGGRSSQAVAYLHQLGHDVVNLDGGMLEWEAAGRPLVSETESAPKIV